MSEKGALDGWMKQSQGWIIFVLVLDGGDSNWHKIYIGMLYVLTLRCHVQSKYMCLVGN